jgi:hypothetical protein
MEIRIDLDILEGFVCLEPDVGEALLPLYPDMLSADEKARFELHLEGCDLCREQMKLWRVTGQALRLEALVKRATDVLANHRYAEAIDLYNRVLRIEPNFADIAAGGEFFQAEVWHPLTAARHKERDLTPYLAPSYAPERYQLAAAATTDIFPLTVEFADGKVKGKITTAGQSVFFELIETQAEFDAGLTLVGRILQPVRLLKAWDIRAGAPVDAAGGAERKKHRLGTLSDLFQSVEFSEVLETLRSFNVLPA